MRLGREGSSSSSPPCYRLRWRLATLDRGLVFFTLYAWARPDREPEGDPGERQAKDAWRCATARRVWTHLGGPAYQRPSSTK